MAKGQELSVTVIIVAAIALIVLVVLVAIFTGKLGKFGAGVTKVESNTCQANCQGRSYESGSVRTACQSGESELTAFVSDVPEGYKCCCKVKTA